MSNNQSTTSDNSSEEAAVSQALEELRTLLRSKPPTFLRSMEEAMKNSIHIFQGTPHPLFRGTLKVMEEVKEERKQK